MRLAGEKEMNRRRRRRGRRRGRSGVDRWGKRKKSGKEKEERK